MDKTVKRVKLMKQDKRCFNQYIKCFTSNAKANELYQRSKVFSDVKNYINSKR